FFVFLQDGFEAGYRGWARPAAGHAHLRAFFLAFRQDFDGHAVALFDLGEITTLGVEQVHGRFGRSVERDGRALALGRLVFNQAKGGKTGAGRGTNKASAIAVRTGASGRFEHAGAQALAAHLHQAEARDAANLDARAVVLERLFHRLLDLTDVRSVFHVDEVDHDQSGHIAQAQLASDFARRLEIGAERGLLDPVFLGGTAGVDVDRDQ